MAEQSKLATRCDGVEWVYNNLTRNEGVTKPVSTYIFGNLIDAPLWHPGTIVTHSRTWRGRYFLSMAYVHLSVDM